VKEFSLDTFRTTKQLFNEMVGKGTKTFDPKVDGKYYLLSFWNLPAHVMIFM